MYYFKSDVFLSTLGMSKEAYQTVFDYMYLNWQERRAKQKLKRPLGKNLHDWKAVGESHRKHKSKRRVVKEITTKWLCQQNPKKRIKIVGI